MVSHPITLLAVFGNQVNFVVPSSQPDGLALLSIGEGPHNFVPVLANIARQAPGIFAANANGQGVAAGNVVRVSADGTQTVQNTAQWYASTSSWMAAPIAPPAAGDQVNLQLPGGLAGAGQVNVIATVEGQAANAVTISFQ